MFLNYLTTYWNSSNTSIPCPSSNPRCGSVSCRWQYGGDVGAVTGPELVLLSYPVVSSLAGSSTRSLTRSPTKSPYKLTHQLVCNAMTQWARKKAMIVCQMKAEYPILCLNSGAVLRHFQRTRKRKMLLEAHRCWNKLTDEVWPDEALVAETRFLKTITLVINSKEGEKTVWDVTLVEKEPSHSKPSRRSKHIRHIPLWSEHSWIWSLY